MYQRMRTSSFTAVEVGTRPQTVRAPRGRGKQKRGKPAFGLNRAFYVKLGICAAALGLMLVAKDLEAPIAAQMVSGVSQAVNDETDLTDILGKLQFVELPGALEVFSGGSQMAYPVSAPDIFIDGESDYAEWAGAPNAEVVASAAGEVRAVGEDDVLGPYVRLQHAGELETIYYGLETINVEQGQPVLRRDTLGKLGEEGVLRLSVLLSGRPQSPANYLGTANIG